MIRIASNDIRIKFGISFLKALPIDKWSVYCPSGWSFSFRRWFWFNFNAFLISLIGLYFLCLSFRVILVNTARTDGAFLFVFWFIHWKRMIHKHRKYRPISEMRNALKLNQLFFEGLKYHDRSVMSWTIRITVVQKKFGFVVRGRK
jgi:hypothetical protein